MMEIERPTFISTGNIQQVITGDDPDAAGCLLKLKKLDRQTYPYADLEVAESFNEIERQLRGES